MSGLFGGTGGLFGNSQTPASQPPKPSLFGTPQQTTQPAAGGGLFGNTLGASTSTTQQPATSGLFGAKPATGGGLFGNTTSQPAQQSTGGMFGQSNNAQPLGTSLFGAQQQQGQQQGQAPPTDGSQLGQSKGPGSLQAAYFDQILERGKKRNNQENGGSLGELPSLQLGLGDIARKVRNLGTGGPSAEHAKAGDSRAHYLLAASGVSVVGALRDLNNFSAQAGAAVPSSNGAHPDTDIEGFVSNLQSRTTLDMIQEGLEQSKRDFDTFLEENVQMNWDAQRRRIYEHFGLVKPSGSLGESTHTTFAATDRDRGAFGRSSRRGQALGASTAGMSFGPGGMSKSVIGTSTMRGSTRGNSFTDLPDKASPGATNSGIEDRYQRDKQEKYAIQVTELNRNRYEEKCYPVLHKFMKVETDTGIDNTPALLHSYEAIISVTKEPDEEKTWLDPGAVRERHFVRNYLDDDSKSPRSLKMRNDIINGSRTCLEKLFHDKVKAALEKDPRVAQVGGIPDQKSNIRGYIRILDDRKELGDITRLQRLRETTQLPDGEETIDDYCWVFIYHLLRCGYIKEASEYVIKNTKAMRNIDAKFLKYMDDYANTEDRRLRPELRSMINSEYHRRIKDAPEDTLDPYWLACYKIMGRCDLSRKVLEGIRTDEEDWLWLQYALAREVNKNEEMADDVFGLAEIRATMTDIGKRHFSQTSDNPGGFTLFFFMQVLAGMYEQAVAWLYTHNHVAAVHFAIALDYYGLLRVADLSATELLSYTTREQPRLHFGLVIGYYTGDFRAARPEAAADYLSLINLNSDLPGDAGIQQAKMCWEALRELVLETREFAALLGDLHGNGSRLQGAIEKRIKLIRLKDDFVDGHRRAQEQLYDAKKFIDTLTVQAAVAADDSGRTTDAVLLYHLAEEHDNVITIINRTLSEALSVELGREPMRLEPLKPRQADGADEEPKNSTLSLTSVDDPVVLARNMMGLYATATHRRKIKQENWESCQILQEMAQCKTEVENRQWISAIQSISHINIIPINSQGDINAIRAAANNFATVPAVIARNVGDLMMWAILCIGGERERLRAGGWEDHVRQETAAQLLQAARDLMVFAGLIRFRLPPRVFEVLARAGQDVGV
ncbi:hypothetical protein BLS_001320 [Venturia inaequalis]|uniref:Nuclear pore protein n=1 Tax=Venturia inaequalis TaxID=5025 RepID=A0A8H3UXM8_VENIN|nr:hypothetical protein BLS_001320 [Venturia inaequalis]